MEEAHNHLASKRQLSLPSLISTDPTSPVATCCACAYLSKSTSDIFRKNRIRDSFSSRKKWFSGSNFLLSVFKQGPSKTEPLENRQTCAVAVDAGFGQKHYLRTTSWNFVQNPEYKNMAKETRPKAASEPSKTNEESKSFAITPTYQSCSEFDMKQQMLRLAMKSESENEKLNSSNAIRLDPEPEELRKSVLRKKLCAQQSQQPDLLTGANVPRSPGPLDGSPYAQVRKKNCGKSNNASIVTANRGFRSAEDLTEAFQNLQAKRVAKNYRGGRSTKHSEILQNLNVLKERRRNIFSNMDDSLENSVENSINELDILSGNGYHEIDALDTGQSANKVQDFSCSEDLKRVFSSSSSQNVCSIEMPSTQQTSQDENIESPVAKTVLLPLQQLDQPYVKSIRPSSSPQHLSKSKDESSRKQKAASKSPLQERKKAGAKRKDSTPLLSEEDTEEDVNSLSIGSSDDDGDVMSELSSTSSSITSNEMRPQAKKQLTKEEVHDAVALINECLSDQEMRNGSLTPVDASLEIHEVLKLSELSASITIDDPNQHNQRSEEPGFSPAQPDYSSKEINQLYANKSPEYALPERDVIHKSVSTRTAEIRVQGATVPQKIHDSIISSSIASKHSTSNLPRQQDSHGVIAAHNSSADSGRDSTHDQKENLRKAASTSDDSGIDGSAPSSTKTAAKPKPVSLSDPHQVSHVLPTVTPALGSDPSTVRNISNVEKLQVVNESPLGQEEHSLEHDDEDAEEKKVREEIENTRKRLEYLHEQQHKLKKERQEKTKRHSFTTAPSDQASTKRPEISATLPRPPGHQKHALKVDESNKNRQPSSQEQKDIEELLRSVQEVNFSTTPEQKSTKIFPAVNMSAVTASFAPNNQIKRFREVPNTYDAVEPNGIKKSKQFTPAYAHPMHQPRHMELHHYQLQHQEEMQRKEAEERQKLQQQERFDRKQKKEEINMQEKRREEERERQQKFEMQFEQRQKQLQKAKPVHKPIATPTLPVKNAPVHTSAPLVKPSPVLTQNSHFNARGSSMTLPSPRKYDHGKPSSVQHNVSSSTQAKSDELQMQLAELDKYIAQLTQNLEETTATDNHPPLSSEQTEVVRRRRSYSIEIERKMDPNIPLSPEETEKVADQQSAPPKPPSRTRSSFESVSKRLSHGFELAQIMRQQSTDKDGIRKDDDVFPTTVTPQPSYPPQTRLTRPIQQQILGTALPVVRKPSEKPPNLEENLSPQLFLAMSVNPGARPVEEIHSYKEDLEKLAASEDVVDGAPQTTPLFPITPTTPYANNVTTPTQHTPAGLQQTPLSALGLKPNQNQTEIDALANPEEGHSPVSAVEQPMLRSNGPTTSSVLPKSQLTSSNVLKNNMAGNNINSNRRSENGRASCQQKLGNGGLQGHFPDNGVVEAKSTLPGHHSYDSGFADTHQLPHASNGWIRNTEATKPKSNNFQKEVELKSPWVHSGSSSPQSSTSAGKSPVLAFVYSSTSGEVSPNASRSLTGSNDSLLSNGSSSNQPHYAYQQQHINGSHPSIANKDSSQRNSGSSIRSTSTGSGYLGGTSRTSLHSTGSPASSGTGQYPLSQVPNRRESQLSAYEKQIVPQGHQLGFQDEVGIHTPASVRTSSSSTSDVDRLSHDMSSTSMAGSAPKFIKDTTAYWYKPDITREQALAMLRDRMPGSFVVRDSRCYPGAFGLALKVHKVPVGVLATAKPGTDMNDELVRHFLIEPSSRGVKLKGCRNEPVFGSLSALIYQHSITPLALPCKLVIPTENQEIPQFVGAGPSVAEASNSAADILRQGAACNVVYISSVDTESLTGPEAVERAMREVLQQRQQDLRTSIVHFKVGPQGITLTDNARKIFFRRHYPTATLTYCGMDPSAREPHNRRWNASNYRGPQAARVFGFVAKKPGSAVDNVCHLFAELDLDQPAPAIVNFVTKVLIGSTSPN